MSFLDDLDLARCIACESEYGTMDCYGCPGYDGSLNDLQPRQGD